MYFIYRTTQRFGPYWLVKSEEQFDPTRYPHEFFFKAKNKKIAAARAREHGLPVNGLV